MIEQSSSGLRKEWHDLVKGVWYRPWSMREWLDDLVSGLGWQDVTRATLQLVSLEE